MPRFLSDEWFAKVDELTKAAAGLDIPKATPAEVAAAIVAGMGTEADEIFPDPMSRQVHDRLCADAKAVERQYATMIPR